MTAQLDVANLALARLGIGKPIGALDEATQPARIMTQFYNQARDEALRDFAWPFARKFLTLTLVAGPSPRASIDFLYSYRYPADCIAARVLRTQPRRPDVRLARVPFIVGGDGSGRLIFTDAAPLAAVGDLPGIPELEYTFDALEAIWPPDFTTAVSQLLAWYASPTLTGGDPHKLGLRAFQEYDRTVRRAWQNNLAEEEPDIDEPDCAFLDARN